MKFVTRIIIGLLAVCGTSHAAGTHFTLENGSVGAVYVTGHTKDTVELKIVFPVDQIPGYPGNFYGAGYKDTAPVAAKGKLIFFDGKGPLFTLKKVPPLKLVFWCENDGGTQFRPEAKLALRTKQLKRHLHAHPELQGLAGFVFYESRPHTRIGNVSIPNGTDVRMKGRLYGKRPAQAAIWVAPDEAQNCDGKPDNNLTIQLKTEKMDASLRCCGP